MNPFKIVPELLRSEKLLDIFKETTRMKSWKTTILGVISLAVGLASIWAPPAYQQRVQATAAAFAGAGLIVAKDHNQ